MTGLALLSNDQALVIFDGKAHEDNGNEPAENENKDAKGCPWKTPCLGIFTFSTAKMTNYLQLPIKKSLFEAQIFSSASIGSRSTTAHAAHFVPDEAQNIITLQFLLTLDIARDRAVGFSVVIAVQPLLDRIEALLKIDPDKRGISWTEWGPDTTRWIPNHALRIASFRATYGCRLITFLRWNIIRKAPPVVISDDGEGPSTGDYIGWGRHLAVLDFGKYAVSNQVKAETPESCIVGDVTEPWSYSGEWSSEVVESRLPFRVHTKYLGNFMEAYLDGSSIVGREVSNFGNRYRLRCSDSYRLIVLGASVHYSLFLANV